MLKVVIFQINLSRIFVRQSVLGPKARLFFGSLEEILARCLTIEKQRGIENSLLEG